MKLAKSFGAIFAILLYLAFSVSPAKTEKPQTVLDRFTGTWTATGNSFGDDIKTTMIWSKTLGGQFHRIEYQINMQNSFNGVAHYKTTKKRTTSGYWVDSSGDLHPLSVKFEDNAIITIWGIAGKKQGRTEYRLANEGQATVTDWLLTKDGWRKFNHGEYVRVPD